MRTAVTRFSLPPPASVPEYLMLHAACGRRAYRMRSLYIVANAATKIREIKNEKIRRTHYEKKRKKRGRDISAPEYKMCIDAFLTSRAFILPSFQSPPLIPLTWQKRESLLWYPLTYKSTRFPRLLKNFCTQKYCRTRVVFDLMTLSSRFPHRV